MRTLINTIGRELEAITESKIAFGITGAVLSISFATVLSLIAIFSLNLPFWVILVITPIAIFLGVFDTVLIFFIMSEIASWIEYHV